MMSVTVHGNPGGSLRASGKYGTSARRGAFHEERVGQATERWLTGRPDHFHLFHDLTGSHSGWRVLAFVGRVQVRLAD